MNQDQANRIRPKILFLVQLPPPVHGVSTINRLIWESSILAGSFEKRIIAMDFARDLRSLRRFTPEKFLSFIRIRRKLKSELRDFRPDSVYFSIMTVGWGFWRDILFVRVIRKAGIRPVFHLHNKGIRERSRTFPYGFFYRYVFNGSRIIHLSPGLLENEIIGTGLKPASCISVGNGIPAVAHPTLPSQDGTFRILFVSNLFPRKGIYLLPVILKKLLESNPDIQLRVVGDFMRRSHELRFRKEMKRQGIGHQLVLYGELTSEAKWNEYFRADLFLFPSIFEQECYPLVVLEAMQAGLPLVASSLGAIPEILAHGETGLLVEPGNVEGYVRETLNLMRNPGLRETLGRNARRQFLERHTTERMESKIAEFLLS